MPPGIEGLADHVVFHVEGMELIKEAPGSLPVGALIDVDHDTRRRIGAGAHLHTPDPGFHEAGEVGPILRQPSIGLSFPRISGI